MFMLEGSVSAHIFKASANILHLSFSALHFYSKVIKKTLIAVKIYFLQKFIKVIITRGIIIAENSARARLS